MRNREPARNVPNDLPQPVQNNQVNPNEINVSQNGSTTVIHIHHHHHYAHQGPQSGDLHRRAAGNPPPYEEVLGANGIDAPRRVLSPARHRRAFPVFPLSGVSGDPRPRHPRNDDQQSSPSSAESIYGSPRRVEPREIPQQQELGAVGGQAAGVPFNSRSFVSDALIETRSETRKLFLFAILKIKLAHPNYTPEVAWTALVNWLRRDGVFERPNEVVTAYLFAFRTASYHAHFRSLFVRSPAELHEVWRDNSGDI